MPRTTWTPINLLQLVPPTEKPNDSPFFRLPAEVRYMIFRTLWQHVDIPQEHLVVHDSLPDARLTYHTIPKLLLVSKAFKAEYEKEMQLRRGRRVLTIQFYDRKTKVGRLPTLLSLTAGVRIGLATVEHLVLRTRCQYIFPGNFMTVKMASGRLLMMMPALKHIVITINLSCCVRISLYAGDENDFEDDYYRGRASAEVRRIAEETRTALLGILVQKIPTHYLFRAPKIPFLTPLLLPGAERGSRESRYFGSFAMNSPRNHMSLVARTEDLTRGGVLWKVEPPDEPEKVFHDLERDFKEALELLNAKRLTHNQFNQACQYGSFEKLLSLG
ncbi:hypothetical protein CBER1_05593 [Cercospora berteroae]|uniref:Uncharacterized protein n=1 Tax=Cercospora berteroae TaxID=357750 RepID=A0A2S6CFJ7_9PEZI|nr:hypothetical protein CBER1_05593 [Cercospora berteroae]